MCSSDLLPMWVADMDFQTAPEIIEALEQRVAHGIFGYNVVPDEWYGAICNWWLKRHDFKIQEEWLVFCTGVVPALSSIVRKMTTVGENVLIQTPVYNIFFNSIVNNGRNVVENKLLYKEGRYEVDFADLEQKLANPQTTLMILCNPHNPIGKIWDRATLEHIGRLCAKHHVLVVSDEIHCDLTAPGQGYIPFASVSECCKQNSITCIAPTKAFNLAGLQTAAVMIPNVRLRQKVERGLNTDEVAEPNSFATLATIAAFTKGEAWLEALRAYIETNKQYVMTFVAQEMPQIRVVPSDATYLVWLDCQDITLFTKELNEFIYEQSGLRLSAGEGYGESGKGFLRLNIACPKARLEEGLMRLKTSLEAYKKWGANVC